LKAKEIMDSLLEEIRRKTQHQPPQEILRTALEFFGSRIALATSFGAEDQVLTDMLCRLQQTPAVFTLDTGRLPQETYEVWEETEKRYGIRIEGLFPDFRQVEAMTAEHGINLFYQSVELRRLCCRIRKIEPLKRKLSCLDAWICGLRREQSQTRSSVESVQRDEQFGLMKISPLAEWSGEQVWEHIRTHRVPYNKLHDRGYPSIGCACCTRAVSAGQDPRSGRWWWENPEQKECGLHWNQVCLNRR